MTNKEIKEFTSKLVSLKNENSVLKNSIKLLKDNNEMLSRMIINNK
jgi:cell division protein FtsB